MNGLDLILKKIEEDNSLEISRIKKEGKKTAEEIIASAEAQAKAEAEKIIAYGDKKISAMLENAKNGCQLLIREEELSAKSSVVADCIEYTIEQLKSMSDDNYFDIITRLILKYHHKGQSGILCMNTRDIDRMPKGFLKSLNKEFKKSGAKLVMADKPINIDSGFIIRYGDIDENCTFDALIEDKMDEIKDRLYSQLG